MWLRKYRTVGYVPIIISYCSRPMKCIRDDVMWAKSLLSVYAALPLTCWPARWCWRWPQPPAGTSAWPPWPAQTPASDRPGCRPVPGERGTGTCRAQSSSWPLPISHAISYIGHWQKFDHDRMKLYIWPIKISVWPAKPKALFLALDLRRCRLSKTCISTTVHMVIPGRNRILFCREF